MLNRDDRLFVWLFVSRNKDNANVPYFKQRELAFVDYDKPIVRLNITRRFREFARAGQQGEASRLYRSVNARDPEMIRKLLLQKLIFDPIDFTHIESTVASIASKKECALEQQWLLDVDTPFKDKVDAVVNIVGSIMDTSPTVQDTPHGKAIITAHGFDSRNLLRDYGDIVTLHKDGMLFQRMITQSDAYSDNEVTLDKEFDSESFKQEYTAVWGD